MSVRPGKAADQALGLTVELDEFEGHARGQKRFQIVKLRKIRLAVLRKTWMSVKHCEGERA